MRIKDAVKNHFEGIAENYDFYKKRNKYYYDNLKKLLKSLIPPNRNVFEIGCGTGDLLNHLKPRRGYGYDVSGAMIEKSKSKYKSKKNLIFSTRWPPATNYQPPDYIFMSDVIEHLENPGKMFEKIAKLMEKNTVFVCTMANPIWEPLLMFWEKMGWKMPEGPHNRIKNEELRIMMKKAGLKIIEHDYSLLIPVHTPIITDFINKYLEKYLKRLAFIEYLVAVRS